MPGWSLRPRFLIPLLFGAAGLGLNLFRFEIFFNVDFIFGSVFVMLAILFAGPLEGVIAAVIAGSATWVLWNHPWALVIFVGEAACVGWLVRRRSWDILLADILFWAVLGAPMVWVFYHQVLQTQVQTTVLIILKQSVNGIINALLAHLLNLAWRARIRTAGQARPAFRTVVFATMVSLVAFPALLFLATYVRQEIRQDEQRMVRRSSELGRVASQVIRDWIADRHRAITTLTALVTRPGLSPRDRQSAVEAVQGSTSAFRRVGVLDVHADVIAYSPLIDEFGHSPLGRNFSDRPYLPILKTSLRPYVGDLVMGRIGPPAPVLPLLVPILRKGRYDGYCIGITNPDSIRDLMQTLAGPGGARLTILDRNGRVASSTRADLSVMAEFHPPAGETRLLEEGTWHWLPPLGPGSSRMQRWRDSVLVHETFIGPDLPWKVRVELPMAPLIQNLTRVSILGLGILLLLILGTVALAQTLSRRFTNSLGQLEQATRTFPVLVRSEAPVALALPSSGIEEMHRLATRFQQMADALQASFQELHLLKDTLEERVVARTEELQTAMDALKTLHGIIPICASCKKIRDDQGSWNQLESYISQHTDADFSHGICPECAKRLYPESQDRRPGR